MRRTKKYRDVRGKVPGGVLVKAVQDNHGALRQLMLLALGTIDRWMEDCPPQEQEGKGPKQTLMDELDRLEDEGEAYKMTPELTNYISLVMGSALHAGRKIRRLHIEATREIKQGDSVWKTEGYEFQGTVVSVFKTTAGKTRYVVDSGGLIHIFNRNQLALT